MDDQGVGRQEDLSQPSYAQRMNHMLGTQNAGA